MAVLGIEFVSWRLEDKPCSRTLNCDSSGLTRAKFGSRSLCPESGILESLVNVWLWPGYETSAPWKQCFCHGGKRCWTCVGPWWQPQWRPQYLVSIFFSCGYLCAWMCIHAVVYLSTHGSSFWDRHGTPFSPTPSHDVACCTDIA